MKIKQTIKKILLPMALFVGVIGFVASPAIVSAAGNKGCETDTVIISCNNVNTDDKGIQNTGLWSILLTVINILTAGVGILAVGGIVYGSILYASAGGSAEQVKKAMTVFTNVVIGIVAYAAMYAFLNFIIPGGIFN
ncbi:MAG TPA: hypothetical protein PLZ58_01190 [Candidatus Saccharibacteria bacterium]|nr:hypothetical protein [Candidatus Saccharibacteria bacterium]HRQ07064.1 hypothetical protein [Candidatus Saccharibacteria bacterium]